MRGQHKCLDLASRVEKLLSTADIVSLSETGHKNGDKWIDLPGFRRIACSMRAHDAEHGGVAVYAKNHIAGRISVVRDLPEYGMVWVKIKGACCGGSRDIFMCSCYLPPRGSSYYTREGTNLNLDVHFDMLDHCTAEFKAVGEVLIMGDLNARTGQADERGSTIEPEEWEHAGAPAPMELVHGQGVIQSVAMRSSCDTILDRDMGERLLNFCRGQGMLILNGRLPGDEIGAHTFHADGRVGSSLVDYFISTPALTFDEEGKARAGTYLNVLDMSAVPKRPGGGNFDHAPITLRISTGGMQELQETRNEMKSKGQIAYRWKGENQGRYVTCLRDDPGVAQCLGKVFSSTSVTDAERSLYEAVKMAISKCDAQTQDRQLKMTIPGKCTTRKNTAVRNEWFNDQCRAARTAYKEAEKQYGPEAAQVKMAFVAYRKETKHWRNIWEKEKSEALQSSLIRDPKRFWSAYRPTKPATDTHDIEAWTRYFTALFKYVGPQMETEPKDERIQALLFPEADTASQQRASLLNECISREEVAEALETAARGKSAGTDGVPMEFFKLAFVVSEQKEKQHVLAEHIAHLLSRVLKEQYLSNTTSALVPVPKPKGSASNLDDHRGIAVGSALAKLYSIVLLKRLDKWAEENGMRAKGQAAFRNGRGTLDDAFVLLHLIEKYKANKKPLYAAFIDFRKAYDSIDRSRLWECLRGMGIHGRILDSLIEMYNEVTMAVRVRGELGPEFQADRGVKQGDPLSPLLFGLFIDRIETVFSNMLPQLGIRMGSMLVQVLLYADDLVLLAESPGELQSMLDLLSNFCVCNSLTVNVKKSEVVIFNSKQHHSGEVKLMYKGHPLTVSPHFVYLGFMFDSEGLGECHVRNSVKGDAARFALIRRCYQMGIDNVALKLHLYDALVKPVINYGCELWGPRLLHLGDSYMGGARGDMEKKHIAFLRSILGVRRSTPTGALMAELQREPLAFAWIRQSANFWNRVLARDNGDVVKTAMLDSVDMAKLNRNCWAHQLRKCLLREAGVDIFHHVEDALCISAVMKNATAKWMQGNAICLPDTLSNQSSRVVRGVPDTIEGRHVQGFKWFTYQRWFQASHADKRSTFWYSLSHFRDIQVVAQFRLGVHWLNVEWGRFQGKPRSERVCDCCDREGSADREDELHLLACPMYYFTRMDNGLFSEHPVPSSGRIPLSINVNEITDAEVCGYMNPPVWENQDLYFMFWKDFAQYLHCCKEKRRQYLDFLSGQNMSHDGLPDDLD